MTRPRTRPARAGSPLYALEGNLEGDADLTRLEEGLAVDVADLDKELAEQPTRYYAAAIAHARLSAELDYAERALRSSADRVEALVRSAGERRDAPATESQVQHRVRTNADVERAGHEAGAARRSVLVSRALRDAYEQRVQVLLALASRLD